MLSVTKKGPWQAEILHYTGIYNIYNIDAATAHAVRSQNNGRGKENMECSRDQPGEVGVIQLCCKLYRDEGTLSYCWSDRSGSGI